VATVSLDHLAHLRRELATVERYLDADLSVPIEHCGDWTLYDLVDHIGGGNLWAAVAVTEQRGNHKPPPAPRDPADLVTWFRGTSDTLLAALEADPGTPAWTFFPPHTVGFWRRRRSLETLVHRWDLEHALGIDHDVDPMLASDGVAEVIDTMVPRMVRRGRLVAPEQAVRLAATDTGMSWVLGPGDPAGEVSGTAADLLLMLWGRLPRDHEAISWAGDREAVRAVLSRQLVP